MTDTQRWEKKWRELSSGRTMYKPGSGRRREDGRVTVLGWMARGVLFLAVVAAIGWLRGCV